MQQESKKTVRTFAWASFFNDMGSDMIYPIWPLFLTTVLNANMAVLGLIDGLGDAIVSISQAVSGYWSDKLGKRKVFVWIGYFCGSVSRLGYAFSTVWQHIIPFRILDRAGKIRGAPRDAIIADVSTKENRGKNFGILRSMDNLGAVVGILITIFLFSRLGYRNLFLFAAIPSAIAALLVIFAIKERKTAPIFKGISFRDISPDFRKFLILSAIFALASFSYSFLLIAAKKAGFTAALIPVLYLIFTAFAAIFSLYFGKLSDSIGRKAVMGISLGLWILVCLTFIFFQSFYAVIAGFILYGLHKAAIEPVQKTFVAELAPENLRASSLGGFQMVIGICALPASLGAGLIWDKVGSIAPFSVSLVLTVIAGIILLSVKEK